MAGLLHHLDYLVERDTVHAIGKHGIGVGIHGAGCGIGITFDAGNLYESAHGVAGKSQMMFERYFGSIFNFVKIKSEKLAESRSLFILEMDRLCRL